MFYCSLLFQQVKYHQKNFAFWKTILNNVKFYLITRVVNETSCRIYSELEKSLRAVFYNTNLEISLLRSQIKSLYTNIKESLQHFNTKISNCSFKTFAWNPNDIFLSERSCYQRIKSKWGLLLTQIIGMRNEMKKIDCPCIGKYHTYTCGTASDYCALKTCDVFVLKNEKISETYAA